MNIVVLCGGLSPERNVSLSSGARIASTLLQNGHRVVLADMFFGLEDYQGDLKGIFDNPPKLGGTKIDETAPDLAAVRASRKLKSPSEFGDRVIELCQMADIVFMALHGQCGEDGKVQAAFDLLGIKYTGSGFLGSAIAMDKDLTKRVVVPLGVKTPEWHTYFCADVTAEKVLGDSRGRGSAVCTFCTSIINLCRFTKRSEAVNIFTERQRNHKTTNRRQAPPD